MIFEDNSKYEVCTTATSLALGEPTVTAPLIELPPESGSWELINNSAVVSGNQIHFFWFWRKAQERKGLT